MPFSLKKNPERVIICGTGAGWELCPKDSSAMIYVLNDLLYKEKYGINYDILFIMDVLSEKPQVLSGAQNLGEAIGRINASGKPLVAPYKYEEIPLTQPFPLERYVKRFGAPYFLNTISYMLAYALLEGAKEINVYGINQASSSEFFYEKASVEYLLGIAIGLGVQVTIYGDKSELLTTKTRFGGSLLYGYNTDFDHYRRDRETYGEGVIRKLLLPPRPTQRTVRKVN